MPPCRRRVVCNIILALLLGIAHIRKRQIPNLLKPRRHKGDIITLKREAVDLLPPFSLTPKRHRVGNRAIVVGDGVRMKRLYNNFRLRQRPLGWNAARAPRDMALGDIADVAPERKRSGSGIRRTDKNLSILRGNTSLIARRIKFLKLDFRSEFGAYTPCERFYAGKIHRRERR